MKTIQLTTTTLALLAITALLPGCKKKYGAGCEDAVALTAPWTDLSLPIDADDTRVCESSSDALKLRSYTWTDEAAAQAAFKAALESAGYAEDRCSDKACYYDKDGYQVSVQPQLFKIKKKTLVTVMMRRREDLTQKKKKS